MLTLDLYQSHLRDVCVAEAPDPAALEALAGDAWRWLRYRRMVRRRLAETLRSAFPRLLSALGETRGEALLEAFLSAGVTRSPFLRDVAGEFEGWLATSGTAELPAFGGDLARLEWSELAVTYAEDDAERTPGEFTMDAPVAVTAAHRLLSLEHAVHRFDPEAGTEPARGATSLCVYRDASTRRATVLEVTPVGFAVLSRLVGGATLKDAIQLGAEEAGAIPDAEFLRATSAWLADLAERSILLGTRKAP